MNQETHRLCKKCLEIKEIWEFYFQNKLRGWRYHTCRRCYSLECTQRVKNKLIAKKPLTSFTHKL